MGSSHLGNTDGYNSVNPFMPKFTVGKSLSVNHLQAIARATDRATITSGNGYQVRRYSNSTVIQQTPYVVGGRATNFRVFGYADLNGNGFATVSIGTVNRAIPKIDSLYLDQVDSEKMPPKISVTGNGYIVIEATYDSEKPFPSQMEIKFVSALETDTMKPATSQYPLASVKFTPADSGKKEPADVAITQLHESGNLSVARIKVGPSRVYWQWWIV